MNEVCAIPLICNLHYIFLINKRQHNNNDNTNTTIEAHSSSFISKDKVTGINVVTKIIKYFVIMYLVISFFLNVILQINFKTRPFNVIMI